MPMHARVLALFVEEPGSRLPIEGTKTRADVVRKRSIWHFTLYMRLTQGPNTGLSNSRAATRLRRR